MSRLEGADLLLFLAKGSTDHEVRRQSERLATIVENADSYSHREYEAACIHLRSALHDDTMRNPFGV